MRSTHAASRVRTDLADRAPTVPLRPIPSTPLHILVVDHDVAARGDVAKALTRQGHTVLEADSGRGAIDLCGSCDLMILNLDLPDIDGLRLCRIIGTDRGIPVIASAERRCEMDCVLALQAGADDYIDRNCGSRELVARIDALMRRMAAAGLVKPAEIIDNGPLRIDVRARRVTVRGRYVELTRKQFDLLALLALNHGEVVARGEIMHKVWDDSWSRRTVDTHVSSLRAKLGASTRIVSVRGVGFRLVTSDEVRAVADHMPELSESRTGTC